MLFKICNTMMNYRYILATQTSDGNTEAQKFKETTLNILNTLIPIICGLMGLVAVLWGVWCAIGFFRASDGEKRDAAKKRLIYSLVAIIVSVILIAILIFVRSNLGTWFGKDPFPKQ